MGYRISHQKCRCGPELTDRAAWDHDMNHNLTGRLLIASPYLSDGHFMRSVVFIVRHELDGAFGLSINRPIEKRFRDLLHEAVDSAKVRDDDQIFIGGPVPGPIMALHNLAGIGDP